MIRDAQLEDLPALLALEQTAFPGDRLSSRQFRRFIKSDNSRTLVLQHDGQLAGYALVLFHHRTHLARLYSLAIVPALRGQGLAGHLMEACEQEALARGYLTLRLEVREDNAGARALYRKRGYRPIRLLAHYYDDAADGIRLEKRLQPGKPTSLLPVPYYAQTLPFTCGPASLLMARSALTPGFVPSRREEVQIWREATTVFMTTGHGGCSALGLALAAHRRDLTPRLWVSQTQTPFLRGVRSDSKRQVMELVQADFTQQAAEADLDIRLGRASLEELGQELAAGHPVLVLISTWRLTGDKAPHWVVLVGLDEQFVFFHDPDVDSSRDRLASAIQVPVRRDDFAAMMQYGQERFSAALALSGR
ncbi:GNAT family N-acetyltransferase/peptidase C39 family protein [Pseudaeromonas paramecii]|uniref:GNAT family N-acetyltransferase/peptidase C39 family protein n=1 Tax=Pseudaeromonas paramecii TaxID=2138166 RepID=A0ABP8Q8U9_9GAMM